MFSAQLASDAAISAAPQISCVAIAHFTCAYRADFLLRKVFCRWERMERHFVHLEFVPADLSERFSYPHHNAWNICTGCADIRYQTLPRILSDDAKTQASFDLATWITGSVSISSRIVSRGISSPNSLFNPHYQVKMDKAHILNPGGAYPLFMIHSEGKENDKPYAHFLIKIAEHLGVSCDSVLMDAVYDSP